MSFADQLFATGVVFGLTFSGITVSAPQGAVLYTEICGRPDMRMAIPLRSDEQDDERDCMAGCHVALCRKSGSSMCDEGGRGAVV